MTSTPDRPKMFFLIGPLRTGSSLLTRCIDDHPGAICLCESEIQRVIYPDHALSLHARRMGWHGLAPEQWMPLLDGKKQDCAESILDWYRDVYPVVCDLYGKYDGCPLGDKSPDFYRTPEILELLAAGTPLIYTVRDPRAILASIVVQDDATAEEKDVRWAALGENYRAWEPYLETPNVLVVRYEDLVTAPETSMRQVYQHLGLPYSSRFLGAFARPHPGRFLWSTAVDWENGIRKDFDPRRIEAWRSVLSRDQVQRLPDDPTIAEFMERFGYATDSGVGAGVWRRGDQGAGAPASVDGAAGEVRADRAVATWRSQSSAGVP